MKHVSLFLKIISGFILLLSWIFLIINYQNLPETVPIHYGFDGTPDGYGSRNMNWFLLILQTAMFIMMYYYSQHPNAIGFNIPQNLKNNSIYADFVASMMLFLVMGIFGVINYESIQNALGKTKGLSSISHYFLGGILIFLLIVIIWSWRLSKTQPQKS